ncbi:response regulator [Hydrogenophaga sp.]|uniref:response regulator n=1 Tax=Hydrogenophaga sp. TaxID=1904254 RepID=UPI003D9BDCDF
MPVTLVPPCTDAAHGAARAVLLVDDEPQARKWFARVYGDEFVVLQAADARAALDLLELRAPEVAVLLSDHRMPGEDGVQLLTQVRERHPHIVRLLFTAYADKDMALAAVNQGQVQRILEKPLDEALMRAALRDALAESLRAARDRLLLERRAAALRETLGFLAHEVSTPLATVRGYLTAMRERHEAAPPDDPALAYLAQRRPGEVLHLIEAAQRRADYAQSLVSTFVQSARDAWQPDASVRLRASELVGALRDDYPFEADEAPWLRWELAADFHLPGRRDLLYLVLCTLLKNALLALRQQTPSAPCVRVVLDCAAALPGLPPQPSIAVIDNGPGIAPELLARLTREPVTTRAAAGGNGMGLLFGHRVMSSLGGALVVSSTPGQGTTVRLHFPLEDA